MNYKVLYRKYRPQDFDTVIGQRYTTELLKNAIVEDKISHAYIFTGPRGTGKTSTARIFAKAINCMNLKDGNPCNECDNCRNFNENPDIIEIDAASNNGVDEIRELINNVRLAPSNLKYKVYIIDEFHMLSTSAFNALLLTLEEPPSNVVFILATTDIQNVPITVLSRCQRYDFKLISYKDIMDRLNYIKNEENIDITEDALKEIAYLSSGGLRDALSILDQISTFKGTIDADNVTDMFGSVSTAKINKIIEFIESNDAIALMEYINEFKNNGVNFVVFINKLIVSLKDILIKIRTDNYHGNLLFDDVYNLILELNRCLVDSKNSIDPFSFIEILLLKYIKNDKNYFPGNNLDSKNTKNENEMLDETIKNEEKDEIVKEDIVINNNDELLDESTDINTKNEELSNNEINVTNKCSNNLIKIRVNNCFVNAKKDYLNEIKEKWEDFIAYEANANKKLLSYIMDTEIVAMSDAYGILMNGLESTVDLINENIESLENDFKLFYDKNCKFIALTDKMWDKTKQEYVNNLKNNVKYSIIDETLEEMNVVENDSELEKLATEIFGNDVEIK